MVFCVRIFLTNCSINDKMFEPISTVKVIMEKDINTDKMPVNDVAGCSGILFCYPSQLSPNSEGNWKPSKAFELTKKGESKICLNSEKEAKLGNEKNVEWHGLIVFKDGKNDVEIFADIFLEDNRILLHDTTPSVLFNFLIGKDNTLKGRILLDSKVDKNFTNSNKNPKPLLDDFPGILALKLDIMLDEQSSKNIETKPAYRQFLWKLMNRCPVNEDFYKRRTKAYSPHKLELVANIYELGCLPGKFEKINKKDLDKRCKEIDKGYKEECEEEMWSTFIICYNSKLEGDDERIELKNKENGFGKKCKKPRQHAIEMRVCARRKSFERDNDKNEYKIEYNVHSKIGFSFTHKSFSFQNSVTITGLINKTNGFMEPPSENNATFTIFTLKLGNEGTHFATLTGLDGKKLDYGSSAKYRINLLFSKRDGYKENIFQMIAEGNEAISLLGLDMELWNYFSRLYDEMEFPSKSCHLTLKLDGYKFHTTSHCDMFSVNQNYITNRLEVGTSLRNLACSVEEAIKQRNDGISQSEICKYKSAETNKMRK
uniref:Uncharacterized protein n=1 Tax=Meloidogyne enterolobii TaxID=390850 RepID=A0A6V7X1Z5_MELEN|nr:unnamed protein product [Meloidogyne enterolobii]